MTISEEHIKKALLEVKDPEIPTISVVDLGIVTGIKVDEGKVAVQLTPTFSGCPALKIMEDLVQERVEKIPGVESVTVTTSFDTQWNTNMISEAGLIALKKHGLAPPEKHSGMIELEVLSKVQCPQCNSYNTEMRSPFGSTLCRSIHFCKNCQQAFEGFKPLS